MRQRPNGFYWISRNDGVITIAEYLWEDDPYGSEHYWTCSGDDGIYTESSVRVLAGPLEPPEIVTVIQVLEA